MSELPKPIVSAVLVHGKTTNRFKIRGARGAVSRGTVAPPKLPRPQAREPEPPPIVVPEPTVEIAEVMPDAEPYRVICISIYASDLARADALVEELKRRGMRRANRSYVIRQGISRLTADLICPPKEKP